jgi:sucrose-6-phosphate hydrolase SacC (GH32 family)
MRFVDQLVLLLVITTNVAVAAEPIVVADFEGSDYGDWKATGNAFGRGPAQGTLPGQMHLDGFLGKGLVNSFSGGDNATGRLTSPPIKIERRFITFLVGGGGWPDETCMNLVVDGKIVRTATGPNTAGGGSERLEPLAWEVGELIGREATIVIVDERTEGWGHINIDQIVQTDDRGSIAIAAPPVPVAKNVTREIVVAKKLLHFPVKNGAKGRVVKVAVDGVQVRQFDIELADADPDWWAPLDVAAWTGKKLKVTANILPLDSTALDSLQQSDTPLDAENLYREPLRSQFHFSAKRGWLNDPNGLVFYNGEYHLFFQHNPYGCGWGNMHWGHATSRDLIDWHEHGDVLYPDDLGPMFSGSAVVDWHNTSGFGKEGKPPLVLIYTAAGNPTTQCIAYSTDGRGFAKFSGNPVVKQITGGNRDPKVFWHDPIKKWVMVLYVEVEKVHTVHFLTSPNLRDWKVASVTKGGASGDNYLAECPDFFELPIDGNALKKKWVLSAANSEYSFGTFDGTTFGPETPKLPGVRGRGFYAAQTYSDTPDGRRIQIGWCQAPSPAMPFNQLMSLPSELILRTTPDGIRLCRQPIKELESLRDGPNQADALAGFRAELIELRAEIEPGDAETVEFNLRGAKIAYDAKKQEIVVNDHRAAAPLVAGKQRLVVFVDRTILEVFASDGLTYVPLPFIPKPEDRSVSIDVEPGNARLTSLQVYKLKSIWAGQAPVPSAQRAVGSLLGGQPKTP